jgi:DNA-binding winged helix-turn-helix (wHTH) protein
MFNSIINDLLSDSEVFRLQIVKNFQPNKDNLKLKEDDIPMFFVSNDSSLDGFQDFLSKKIFNSTLIVFNSSKEDLNKDNPKILSFKIPLNLNHLFQALQNILIQKEGIEYHDIKFKKLFLNMTGKTIADSKVITKLTDKEAKILWHLVKGKGQNVSQSFLLNKVWGYKDDIETKTLTTHIYTIRKKLNNFNNIFSIENSEEGYCVKFKSIKI